jgi:hypothetical protein
LPAAEPTGTAIHVWDHTHVRGLAIFATYRQPGSVASLTIDAKRFHAELSAPPPVSDVPTCRIYTEYLNFTNQFEKAIFSLLRIK